MTRLRSSLRPRRARAKSATEVAFDEQAPRPVGAPPDSVILRYVVPAELAGQRLDRFIQYRIPRLSRTRAQAIIRSCAVRLDGARRRPSDIVRSDEVVYLVRERFVEPETPQHFGVVHQDDELLIVDKPAGLPMHPSATYHRNTLTYLLRERYENEFAPRIAHRLDRETSGLVICARTAQAERTLKRAFEQHRIQKTYLAIVRGELAQDEGEIALPIAPVREGLHVLMEVREDGLTAHTHYRVLGRRRDHSLVELFPKSGRQHQLRVHLSAIGHSIVGDKLYGPEREAPFLEIIEQGGITPELLERLGLPRQALHAHRLQFVHPTTGLPFEAVAPMPTDMQELWESFSPALTGAPPMA